MPSKETMRASIAKEWEFSNYYDIAEEKQHLDIFWGKYSPFTYLFSFLDCTNIVELACGQGRHVPMYMQKAQSITLVDVNETNIAFCRNRFYEAANITYITNMGNNFTEIVKDSSVSAIFAMMPWCILSLLVLWIILMIHIAFYRNAARYCSIIQTIMRLRGDVIQKTLIGEILTPSKFSPILPCARVSLS